jgi:hypothetical protein
MLPETIKRIWRRISEKCAANTNAIFQKVSVVRRIHSAVTALPPRRVNIMGLS